MSYNVHFSAEPKRIMYMPLPDGHADVWLRQNIRLTQTEDGPRWEAEEVYMHTTETFDAVERNFDEYFAQAQATHPTDSERLDALEAGLAELAEVMSDG